MKKEHFEILLENMNDKFDLVLEGHAGLNARMDRMESKFEERFDRNEFKMEVMGKQLVSIDARLSGVEDKLSTLETKVDGIASDLKDHRMDTEAHPGYMVRERSDGDE